MFYIFQNGSFIEIKLEENASSNTFDAASVIVAKNLPKDLVSIAPLGKTLYYVTSSDPAQVVKLNTSDDSKEITSLSEPCTKLLSSCNKMYCLSASKLFAIDPLCPNEIEHFDFPAEEEIVDITALSVGFSLRSKAGHIFIFQFGVGAEPSNVFAGSVLGQIRRQAVALGPTSTTIRMIPLEGQATAGVAPDAFKLDDIVTGCDDTSGNIIVLKSDNGVHVLGNKDNNDWTLRAISGLDIAIEQPVLLVSEPVADAVETCNICFDDITEMEAITLDCGHAFHTECVEMCLMHAEKYLKDGTKIKFNMAMCPGGCGRIIRHSISKNSTVIMDRYRNVRQKAAQRAATEYPEENASEVIEKFLYYVCDKCKEPFWGGNKDCAATLGGEPTNDPTKLICEDCQTDFVCPTHKREFVIYKCKYCCNPANHLSFGTTRVCERCHAGKVKEAISCPREEGKCCPLPAGHGSSNEVPIGCAACLTTEQFDASHIVAPEEKKEDTKK